MTHFQLVCRGSRGLGALSAKLFAGCALFSILCSAQQTPQQSPEDLPPAPSTSFASQFFEHDYVDLYGFGNAIYDSEVAQVGNSGYGGSWGYDVGGGITLGHAFKDGNFSLSYRGDYRHYENTNYGNGTDQNLSILYAQRLNRHWNLSSTLSGGILTYGGVFYASEAGIGPASLTNPLSSRSRFASAGITLTYQQTRRLSYSFGGQGFYNNFNYQGAFSSIGGSGIFSINYRTTARTTIGATYSHSYFDYEGALGTTNIDGVFLTLSHQFTKAWTASLSAGANRSHSMGTITTPVTLLLGQQLVSGFIVGPYNTTTDAPSFQGSLSYLRRQTLLSVSGGQGVNAGNGTFLTSKNQFASAAYSVTRHRTNFSFAGGYNRLTSISNTVNNSYSSATFGASYGFNIVRYLSANIRYDFIHYDSLYSLKALNENRLTIGLTASTKSVPLTLF